MEDHPSTSSTNKCICNISCSEFLRYVIAHNLLYQTDLFRVKIACVPIINICYTAIQLFYVYRLYMWKRGCGKCEPYMRFPPNRVLLPSIQTKSLPVVPVMFNTSASWGIFFSLYTGYLKSWWNFFKAPSREFSTITSSKLM